MTESAATTRDPYKTKLAGSITCPPVEIDGLPTSYQQSFAIELDRLGPEELNKALADSEMITSLLREHPDEMMAILNDAMRGRTEAARQSALRIGLTEEAFKENRGGLIFWCGIIVAGIMIYSAAATTPPQ